MYLITSAALSLQMPDTAGKKAYIWKARSKPCIRDQVCADFSQKYVAILTLERAKPDNVPSKFARRVSGTLTRHILRFDIPLTSSTESNLRNPDKDQLRADILSMRECGMSYREIAQMLGIHWTRVGQIAKRK